MKLLFKILRAGLNPGQIVAFTAANVVGLAIVVLGLQVYREMSAISESGNSIVQSEYLVVSKPVTGITTLSSVIGKRKAQSFKNDEIRELESLDGVDDITEFSSSHFPVLGSVRIMGTVVSTSMFLEAVPDKFLDVKPEDWSATLEDDTVPVIVPQSYLDMYNYGFASSQGLPQIGQGILSVLRGNITIGYGTGRRDYSCRISGFSNRINSILVPADFLESANLAYTGGEEYQPARLILLVRPENIAEVSQKIDNLGYEIEGDSARRAKISSALKVALVSVTAVGTIMSILSFVLLLVSILLMIQKNKSRNDILRNLGYSESSIAMPYQIVAIAADALSSIAATLISVAFLPRIDRVLCFLQPDHTPSGSTFVILASLCLFVLLAVLHIVTIRFHLLSKSE